MLFKDKGYLRRISRPVRNSTIILLIDVILLNVSQHG